jgi:hypothetical protein
MFNVKLGSHLMVRDTWAGFFGATVEQIAEDGLTFMALVKRRAGVVGVLFDTESGKSEDGSWRVEEVLS